MLSGVYSGGYGEPPQRGTQEYLESYETTPWVRAVAGRVAQEVGSTEWRLKRSDRDEPVPRHILLQVLRKPNALMSGRGLFRVTQLSLDLVGDAFWLKVRNKVGAPVEFYPIPAHWIAETPTPQRPRFRVSWRSWQAEVPETEVVWLHDPAPANPYLRGSGVVRAIGDEIETDEYAAKHAKQLFFNRAMPELVVQDPGADGDELKRHEMAWNQKLQGLFRAFKPYFVNRKLEFFQPQQMNMENLTLVPLRKHERDIQLQCWGMPPEQLGIIENSNRATIEASDYVFQRRLIKPRRDFLADELSLKLCPEYDERLVLAYVDTVPADKEYQLNVAKAASWAFDVDEVREMAGRPPLPDGAGKVRAVPLNYYITDDLMDQEQRPQGGSGGTPPSADVEEPEETPAA
jgi:HK97 family phage portal protein